MNTKVQNLEATLQDVRNISISRNMQTNTLTSEKIRCYIDAVKKRLNETVHRTTGYPPASLFNGVEFGEYGNIKEISRADILFVGN